MVTDAAIMASALVAVIALRAALAVAGFGLRLATWLLIAALAVTLGHREGGDGGRRGDRAVQRNWGEHPGGQRTKAEAAE